MQLSQPFDPIAPGEADNFGFDFTGDVGAGNSITSTSWACTVKTPPPSGAVDPAPQAHIAAVYAQKQIGIRVGQLVFPVPPFATDPLAGAFSVARVGGFTVAAIGATYNLAATVVTSDGRTLTLSADLPIGQL